MRRLRQGLGLLLTIGLGMVGCADRNIALRPPKHPEEILVPPEADGKYSTPPKYPEPTNANDDERAARGGGGGQPNVGAMNTGGMGGGMGGMGGMGMGGMGMGAGSMLGGYGR